jgi:hypothetical protein
MRSMESPPTTANRIGIGECGEATGQAEGVSAVASPGPPDFSDADREFGEASLPDS